MNAKSVSINAIISHFYQSDCVCEIVATLNCINNKSSILISKSHKVQSIHVIAVHTIVYRIRMVSNNVNVVHESRFSHANDYNIIYLNEKLAVVK